MPERRHWLRTGGACLCITCVLGATPLALADKGGSPHWANAAAPASASPASGAGGGDGTSLSPGQLKKLQHELAGAAASAPAVASAPSTGKHHAPPTPDTTTVVAPPAAPDGKHHTSVAPVTPVAEPAVATVMGKHHVPLDPTATVAAPAPEPIMGKHHTILAPDPTAATPTPTVSTPVAVTPPPAASGPAATAPVVSAPAASAPGGAAATTPTTARRRSASRGRTGSRGGRSGAGAPRTTSSRVTSAAAGAAFAAAAAAAAAATHAVTSPTGRPGTNTADAAPIGAARSRRHRHRPAPAASSSFQIPIAAPIFKGINRVVAVIPTVIWLVLAALVAIAAALAARARLIARRAKRLELQREQLLEDVGLLQRALLPDAPALLSGVATSAAYRPADGPGAGGDFYDVFALDEGRVGAIIGDIAGHGRPALSATTLVRFTLRAYLEAGLSPRHALQTAEGVLARQLPQGLFATVLLLTFEPSTGTLTYASAGHPHPVIDSEENFRPVIASSSPPLGTGWPTGRRQTTLRLAGDATLCMYTDGLPEAKVDNGLFGEARLRRCVAELAPEDSADALLARIADLADARPDDMAACLLRLPGQGDGALAERTELLELDDAELSTLRPRRFLEACGLGPEAVADVLREVRELLERSARAEIEIRLDRYSVRAQTRPVNVSALREARRSIAAPQEVAS